ncbi:MAG: phage holin family protein [Saprospiraceae bacterium]
MSYITEPINLLIDINTSGISGGLTGIVINTLVLLGCNKYLDGVSISTPVSAVIMAVIVGLLTWVFGIVNFGFLNFLTLGIWSLVVTAAAIMVADKIMDSVKFDGFKTAMLVAFAMAAVNFLLGWLF